MVIIPYFPSLLLFMETLPVFLKILLVFFLLFMIASIVLIACLKKSVQSMEMIGDLISYIFVIIGAILLAHLVTVYLPLNLILNLVGDFNVS